MIEYHDEKFLIKMEKKFIGGYPREIDFKSIIQERCVDLKCVPKTIWRSRNMAAISTSSLQTSGSSDMPYMICDVLVVFLERHVLSYDLSHFSHSRCYLAKYKKHTFLVFLVQQRELTCPQFFTHANFPLTVYFYSSFFSLIRDHRS